MRHVPVVVLGAGLTGLSAGLALQRLGIEYCVLEKSPEVGGLAVTTQEQGFRFDRTGHLLHLRSESLKAEVLEWLEGDCLAVERRSLVFSSGVYTDYPFQANTWGLPAPIAYECVLGFIRAPGSNSPRALDNFEQYCLAHFGAGFTRHFMVPYNAKLWGVPLDQITASWCQRFVPIPTLEQVIAGAVGLVDREIGYNARFLYPRLGIGQLSLALARRIENLTLEQSPLRIRAEARQLVLDSGSLAYDVLISSAPLPTLLGLFERLPPEVLAARNTLRSTHLYYLDVALSRPPEKRFHWAYVPEARFPFYRIGSYSEFSPEMAPKGKGSLYVELSDRQAPQIEELLPRVIQGLVEMGVITRPDQVEFCRLRRIDSAYVLYDHHHESAMRVIRPFLESVRVISTGRYGGWNYSSMEDALLFGREAVQQAHAWLELQTR